jgi:hypothetical protein
MPSSKRPATPDPEGQPEAEAKPSRKGGGAREGRSSSGVSPRRRSAVPAAPAADDAAIAGWVAPRTASSVDHVEVDSIDTGWEPQRTGEAPLESTIAAIRAVGVVDPVLLRPHREGRYEVVTGHRTVAAARAAGMARVPAVVKELDDVGALMALVFDGSASGQVTPEGAAELRARLRTAGAGEEDIEDVMAAVPVAEAVEPEAVAAAAGAEAPSEVERELEELPVAAAEAEPVLAPPVEAEPVVAAPEFEPVLAAPAEPEPISAAPVEPEPVVAAPAFQPVLAAPAEPEPAIAASAEREPVLAGRAGPPEGADRAAQGRWLPLPAGRPRLARLSSAFADAPRMLGILAGDRFTGTVELVGRDGRKDAVAFLDGRIMATYVEQGERAVDAPLRLPTPDRGPTVEITVRPHPRAVSVALALALRSPTRFTGLHADFLHLPGLLDLLRRERADAACVVSAATGSGVILLDGGQPIAAYARRWGDEPGEDAETTDVSAVLELLTNDRGEVDVHSGAVPEPLDLDDVIARAVPGD